MVTNDPSIEIKDTSASEIQRIFQLQQANKIAVGGTTAKERIAKLKKMHKVVLAHREAMREAMWKDFRKGPQEVDLTELYIITSEIKHAIRHLRRWMRPHRVPTPLAFMGGSSWYQYESKGVCLLISPWNFPFNLTLGPLVGAIAAGNCVMIKPAEATPHSSRLMKKMIGEIFPENEVTVVEGAVQTSSDLLDLPFNHIFFTGSPGVGKIVMAAAAKHLATVTLELGGKNPTIVDETASIDSAAKRIAIAKFTNNGQLCVAPDYIWVHESKKEEFTTAVIKWIKKMYSDQPKESKDLPRLVNQRNLQRIKGYVEQAQSRGGIEVKLGGEIDEADNYIAPTVIESHDLQSDLLQEEIFGPVLPITTFRNIPELLAELNTREKPLCLYIYSTSKKNIREITRNTRAGTTAINNSAVQFYINNLPFGGSNKSGMGNAHGFYSFKAFSDSRAFYRQNFMGAVELLRPPFKESWKQKLIDLTIRWL